MSMPAFARRIIELEKKVEIFEAYRYSRIGSVVDVTAPDLPLENCMWADGSLALFDLWPELKAKYEKGGFSGLLLPYNCSDEDKKAYPLKWVPDSANPTGLFVPRLNGLFARYCASITAGKYNPAGLPEAAGGIYTTDGYELMVANGVLTTDGFKIKTGSAGQASPGAGQNMAITQIEFWASGCNSIYGASHTVMPPSADIPVALYLGSPAKV